MHDEKFTTVTSSVCVTYLRNYSADVDKLRTKIYGTNLISVRSVAYHLNSTFHVKNKFTFHELLKSDSECKALVHADDTELYKQIFD
jgi:hypothetical protein